MKEEEINKKLKEAIELCKLIGWIAYNTEIDGYYVQFEFRKLKPICEKCGQVIE